MNKRLTDVNKKRLIGCVWGTISSLVGLIVIFSIVYYVKYNDINWGITLLTLGMTAALGLGAAFVYYRKLLASQIESDYHLSNEEKEKEIAKLGIDRDEIKGIVRAQKEHRAYYSRSNRLHRSYRLFSIFLYDSRK